MKNVLFLNSLLQTLLFGFFRRNIHTAVSATARAAAAPGTAACALPPADLAELTAHNKKYDDRQNSHDNKICHRYLFLSNASLQK